MNTIKKLTLDIEDGRHSPNAATRAQHLAAEGRGEAEFQKEIVVAPQAEYFFRARVRGNDRAYICVGDRKLGYQDVGQWQTIADVIRTPNETRIALSVHLGGLRPSGAVLEICDVRLCPTARPALPPRNIHLPTALARAGRAEAVIIYPAGRSDYESLAREISALVRRRTGCDLPICTDTDATGPDSFGLRREYRERPLIILGRLGINRAIWTAYNRFLCAVDGHYPGGDGYVVHTAASVFPNGCDHIILGGSSDCGAARAARRFREILESAPAGPRGDLMLPWLLEVELGGRCRELFDEDDRLWSNDPAHPRFPAVEPGYGTVARWYYNAMGYYWSGRESYRRRAVELLDRVIADNAYTHHYITEWLVRVHDMLDDSPAFAPEKIAALDELILKNFWEHLTGPDLGRMEIFAPPYEDIMLANRHNITPWMADLAMAEFLQNRFALTAELAEIAEYRRREKAAMLDHCIAERWDGSLPSIAGPDNEDEIVAAYFRYALEHDRYDFFHGGRAERALMLERINHRFGRFVRPAGAYDYTPTLGMLACCLRDGRYAALLRELPEGMAQEHIFQNRSINGVHRYTPGDEIPSAPTDTLCGVLIPPMQPHSKRCLQIGTFPGCVRAAIAPDEALDFICFRGGFRPEDDYIAITGTAGRGPAGAFLDFTARGEYWFGVGASAIFAPPSESYFDQNAVHILRTDRPPAEPQPRANAARRNWAAALRAGGAVSFTVNPVPDAAWRRDVFWIRPGLCVVRDTVEAQREGEYDISVNWFPEGEPSWDGRTWTSRQGAVEMRLTPMGDGFRTVQNATADRETRAEHPYLRQIMSIRLKPGAAVSACTILQVEPVSAHSGPGQFVAANPDVSALVQTLMLAPTAGLAGPDKSAQDKPAVTDAAWPSAWRYPGLLRPALIRGSVRLRPDLVDLGREARLHEVRAFVSRGKWQPKAIPRDLMVALPENGQLPADGSSAWQPLPGSPAWVPGIASGNYGRADPVRESHQVLRPGGTRVRFLRSREIDSICCFDAGNRRAGSPLKIDLADLDGDGSPELVISPDVWPPFIRKRCQEDTILAVLTPDGRELFKFQPECNIQEARILDPEGSGHACICVLTDDAQIRILDSNGQVRRQINLYAMHQEFNAAKGRPNTRHPAGGFTMPYSVGLWRPGPDGRRKMIVARYCGCSFINAAGEFEGVLNNGSYVLARLLAGGIDLDGDGVEEQLGLGYEGLHLIDGDGKPYIMDPNGHFFYPQVYRDHFLPAPAVAGGVDGTKIHFFDPVRLAGTRYVLIVRSHYLALYDGRRRAWAFTWTPAVAITAAMVTENKPDRLCVAVATEDRRLWTLRWGDDPRRLADFATQPMDDIIRRLRPNLCVEGEMLACSDTGLFIIRETLASVRIAAGAYQDAVMVRSSQSASPVVIAVSQRGEVLRMNTPA